MPGSVFVSECIHRVKRKKVRYLVAQLGLTLQPLVVWTSKMLKLHDIGRVLGGSGMFSVLLCF